MLVKFSGDQTKWLPVRDVVFARQFRNLDGEPRSVSLGEPQTEIYVSDAVGQPLPGTHAPQGQVLSSELHGDVDTAVCFGTPRVGLWLGRVWPRKRSASR